MEEFLNEDMKDKLRALVGQFGRPLTEAERRKWLHGIEDEVTPEVGVNDMLNLMMGQPTELEQANAFAKEMGVSAEAAQILQTYYRENKYARPDMATNWRSLDYLERKTRLPRSKISEILNRLHKDN